MDTRARARAEVLATALGVPEHDVHDGAAPDQVEVMLPGGGVLTVEVVGDGTAVAAVPPDSDDEDPPAEGAGAEPPAPSATDVDGPEDAVATRVVLLHHGLSAEEADRVEARLATDGPLWFQECPDPDWLGLVHQVHPWVSMQGRLVVAPVAVVRPLAAVLADLDTDDGFAGRGGPGAANARPATAEEADDVARAQRRAARAELQRDQAVKDLARLRGSRRYRIGDAVVRSRHSPAAPVRLVARAVSRRLSRLRPSGAGAATAVSGSTVHRPVAARTTGATATPSTEVRQSLLAAPRVRHEAVLLVGDRHLLPDVLGGPPVVTVLPGSLGPSHAQVASASLLVVDGSVDSAPGPWHGVGQAAAVRLTADLRALLQETARAGVPAILLQRPSTPGALAGLPWTARVTLGEGHGRWSPGVDVDGLPGPTGPRPGVVRDLEADVSVGWRTRPGGLLGRLVGVHEVVTADPVVALTAACAGAVVRPAASAPHLLDELGTGLPPLPGAQDDDAVRAGRASRLREAVAAGGDARERLLRLYSSAGAVPPATLRHGRSTTVLVLADGPPGPPPTTPTALGTGPVRLVLVSPRPPADRTGWWDVVAASPSSLSARAAAGMSGGDEVLLCREPADQAVAEALGRPDAPSSRPVPVVGGVLLPATVLASMDVDLAAALDLLGGTRG